MMSALGFEKILSCQARSASIKWWWRLERPWKWRDWSSPKGRVEIDLKGMGKSEPGFLGVAFSVVDGKTLAAVYFRRFNFSCRSPDQP